MNFQLGSNTNKAIFISPGEIQGKATAPASKSISIRAIVCGLLASDETNISNASVCEDSMSALNIIKSFGAEVNVISNVTKIKRLDNSSFTLEKTKSAHLDCGESALCLRLFSFIAGLFDTEIVLKAENTLLNRQTIGLEKIFSDLGAICKTQNNFPPFQIKGPIKSGKISIDGSGGSQLLTGMLFALPLLYGDSEIIVENLRSKPYIDLTLDILNGSGIEIYNKDYQYFFIKGKQNYKCRTIKIEGDWSGAAFLLAAAAISGSISIEGLNINSHQPDKRIIDVLTEIGANVDLTEYCVEVEKNELKAFCFDASDCPDLVPVLAVLACYCQGISKIYGVDRLLGKESDRAASLIEELSNLGAEIRSEGNYLIIKGKQLKGGIANSHNDHRIAMALAVAATGSLEGITLSDYQCVNKSYPRFFDVFDKIRPFNGDLKYI
ncbi:MAG: 3-phosphoshikimate 1-carboxyvinyltransferase [Candidatus Kapabacteria bacterium]|nr:3-phosphoshikimate 1-carboxyvinyltransferase [Candidatus Kapabacteria bacterium]